MEFCSSCGKDDVSTFQERKQKRLILVLLCNHFFKYTYHVIYLMIENLSNIGVCKSK